MKTTVRSLLRDKLARNMSLHRAEPCWSREVLAAEAGVNGTYLSAVNRSEQKISLYNIDKIAVAPKAPAWAPLQDTQNSLVWIATQTGPTATY